MNTPPMEQWIEALRSDRYTQAKGALKTDDGMCCLGVASDICPFGEWSDRHTGEGYDFHYAPYEDEQNAWTSDVDLIRPIGEWLGIPISDGTSAVPDSRIPWALVNRLYPEIEDMVRPSDTEDNYVDLAALNDCGVTFHQIADLIEARWVREETE